MGNLSRVHVVAVMLIGSVMLGIVWSVYAESGDTTRSFVDAYRSEISQYPDHYDPMDITAKYYDALGPDAMLDVLEERTYCHVKAHNLGRLIYIKSGRDLMKALDIAKDRCTDGAFHGVLMQVLDDIGVDRGHVEGSEFAAAAVSFCDTADVSERVPAGSCIHGVGHALMQLAENDIEKGLRLCDIFPREVERYYCATGVYMQREKTVGAEDALMSDHFPCDVYGYPAACYRFKLRDVYAPSEPYKAAAVCAALPEGLTRSGCFHGLGFGFYKNVHRDPMIFKDLCNSPFALDVRLCIEGVIGAVMQNLDTARAQEICALQPKSIFMWCDGALAVGNSGMNRDMSVYYVRNKK